MNRKLFDGALPRLDKINSNMTNVWDNAYFFS
jgi:hypothetical protein